MRRRRIWFEFRSISSYTNGRASGWLCWITALVMANTIMAGLQHRKFQHSRQRGFSVWMLDGTVVFYVLATLAGACMQPYSASATKTRCLIPPQTWIIRARAVLSQKARANSPCTVSLLLSLAFPSQVQVLLQMPEIETHNIVHMLPGSSRPVFRYRFEIRAAVRTGLLVQEKLERRKYLP